MQRLKVGGIRRMMRLGQMKRLRYMMGLRKIMKLRKTVKLRQTMRMRDTSESEQLNPTVPDKKRSETNRATSNHNEYRRRSAMRIIMDDCLIT